MPRIPRAEVSLETRIADQPFSSGDGYAAPGRAMQQLGQGIASFGAGLEAWNAKDDEQNAFKDDLTLLKAANQTDRDLLTYRETYRGDGSDYDRGAQEIIQRNLNIGDQMVSKRGRERFALNHERLSGARREQAMRQGASLREKSLYEDTATAIGGQMQQLLEDADKDPEAFTEKFEKKLSEIEMIIDRMPIGAHRTALEKHAASLAKSMLEGRGLKELPLATELIKKWSAGGGTSQRTEVVPDLSAYSPQAGGSRMEGGYQSSVPGPDGKREVRTLADVAAGRSQYVTIAGNKRDYGKTFTIPKISFVDAQGKTQSLNNVQAVVHDTGSAFYDAPEGRFDVAIDRNATNDQMQKSHALWKQEGVKFVSAGGTAGGQVTQRTADMPIFPIGGSMQGKTFEDVPSAGKSPKSRDFGPDVRRTESGSFRSHAGLDIPGKIGDPVYAVRPGTVVRMGKDQNGYGPFVDIKYDDGTIHRKAHLGDVDKGGKTDPFAPGLKVGDRVSPGQTIGYVGIGGNAGPDFPHVHYEVFKDEKSYEAGGSRPSRYGLEHRMDPRQWFASGDRSAASAVASSPADLKGRAITAGMRAPNANGRQQEAGAQPKGGILTSLEDAPSVDEIETERPSIVDMDLNARGASKALMAAKRVGAKVAAYHEGGGGGASWGEGERDLKSDKELAKLAKDAKALASKGADYLHVDNMHNLDAAGVGKVAAAVRQATDGKMSIIAKNNPAAWVEAIKANPEIKPPYAVIEHGMKDPATLAAAKQLSDMGVPVHFIEFNDPGKDKITGKPRTDPISTAEEARAFAKGNAWANVIHMPTQDRYDGRSVNGAQVFRGEQPSEGGPTQVAQARTGVSDAGPSNTIGTRRGVRGHLSEMLIKDIDQMGKRHEKAIEDALKAAEDMVPKGVLLPQEQLASLGALLDKTNRKDLQARFFAAIVGAQATAQYQKATPFEIEAETNRLRQQILGGKATPQASSVMVKHIEALEKLQDRISSDLKKDPLGLAVQTGQMPNYREITRDGFSPEALNNRISEARAVSQRYGIDLHAFTPGEVTWMTDVMKAGGKPMEMMLGTIAASFGPDTPAAMKQFAKHAPVAAQVGWLVSRQGNPETIRELARGVAMQQDEKHKSIAPTPGQAWMQATKVMGASLAQLAGPNGDGQQAVVDAANILYDVRARAKGVSRQGGSDFDSALWEKGFREVLGENTVGEKTYGGVSKAGGWFGGLHYIVPPNIAQDSVPKLLQNLKPTDIYGGGLPVEKGAADIKPPAPGPGTAQEVTPPGSLLQTRKREPAPEGPIDKFEAEGISQTAAAMRMTGTAPAPDQPVGSRGEPVSMATIRQGKLVTVGDGRYWIATGDLDDPKYIKTLDGRNWVLDLHQYEPVLRRRVPDAYRPN